MDPVGLEVLLREIEADCAVAKDAAGKAELRLREKNPGHAEACAYELARVYNVLEKIFERVCEAFENHFEKRGDYHERLLQRLSLDLPGIRPPFVPAEYVSAVRELKGFRHVFRHAYDLTLKVERLDELATIARDVTGKLPEWSSAFAAKVRTEQGWGENGRD